MPFNNEQLKSFVRWVISLGGGVIAGWAAKSGFITTEQVMSILTSETAIGVGVSAIGLIWSLVARTKVGILTAAASVPEVKQIELRPVTTSSVDVAEVNRLAKSTPPEVRAGVAR